MTPGWGIAGVSQLLVVATGALRVNGQGDATVFANNGSGGSEHIVLVEGFTQRNGRWVAQILDSNEGARFFVPLEEFATRYARPSGSGLAVLVP